MTGTEAAGLPVSLVNDCRHARVGLDRVHVIDNDRYRVYVDHRSVMVQITPWNYQVEVRGWSYEHDGFWPSLNVFMYSAGLRR